MRAYCKSCTLGLFSTFLSHPPQGRGTDLSYSWHGILGPLKLTPLLQWFSNFNCNRITRLLRPESLLQFTWVRDHRFTFLTSFEVMPMLLVWGPHFENPLLYWMGLNLMFNVIVLTWLELFLFSSSLSSGHKFSLLTQRQPFTKSAWNGVNRS